VEEKVPGIHARHDSNILPAYPELHVPRKAYGEPSAADEKARNGEETLSNPIVGKPATTALMLPDGPTDNQLVVKALVLYRYTATVFDAVTEMNATYSKYEDDECLETIRVV
jgi:hypothetical protein